MTIPQVVLAPLAGGPSTSELAAAGTAPAREPPFELTFRLDAGDYQAFLRKPRWSGLPRRNQVSRRMAPASRSARVRSRAA